MTHTIIKVKGLGKKYMISHEKQESYTAFRDVISKKIKSVFINSKSPNRKEEFWALKGVDFEIKKGESVGIIGRNGAGKSTLLKILSQITEPTKGHIEINGRIASLLEVGTGFHPELTGRENIFLNGAILGMKQSEIKKKFEEIVDFSGVEKFLDTPVKRYSSGMYVRLAFSVAAHLEPEILVVDEVLAVGDAEFQKKCLGRMQDVSKNNGRTVLFVSHNMAAISTLCTKGILLNQGQVIAEGPAKEVIDQYILIGKRSGAEVVEGEIKISQKNNNLNIKRIALCGKNGPSNSFGLDEDIICEIEYEIVERSTQVVPSIHVLNKYGDCILASFNSHSANLGRDEYYGKLLTKGNYVVKCILPKYFLNDTQYSISVFLADDNNFQNMTVAEEVLTFEVHETGDMRFEYTGNWIGQIRPKLEWKTLKVI